MKKPFEVGQRVRIYDMGLTYKGTISDLPVPEPFVSVTLDDGGYTQAYNPKQLRRIKKPAPKPEEERWVFNVSEYTKTFVSGSFSKLDAISFKIDNVNKIPFMRIVELKPGEQILTASGVEGLKVAKENIMDAMGKMKNWSLSNNELTKAIELIEKATKESE